MIRISDNLEVNKPAPIDDRLGVFSSTASALAYIPDDRRYIGLTVIVDTGSGATEYWFENGVENADLVAKSTGGGGATWGTITGTLSNQTDLQNALNAKVPYTGATQDVDLGVHNSNAKSFKINGTAGSGHLGLKHQSANATAGGQETSLFAGSDGELYYKNDGNTVAQIPSKSYVDTELSTKENTITAGTTSQYFRGDKTFQTLDKTAVGLGNVDNTSDANKPISTATQTALSRITTLFQDVSQLSTTSTTAVTLTTFTVASANIPVGGVIRIVGLAERTAGANNTTIGLNVNSAGARYFQSAGQTMQFEMLICKMTATTMRYGLGPLGSTTASYNVQNIASVSATQDGSGNFVISLLGFVGTSGATLTIQFVKGNLL